MPLADPAIHLALGLLLGVALSAAAGFRVFVPPLVLCVASLFFDLPLPTEMAFLSTFPAFFIFLTASLIEVGAYYVPWIDHLLDTITAPVAVIAGTLLTYGFISNSLDPVLQWTIALVAGGGAAGTVQAVAGASRLTSSSLTLGLGNPIFATLENILAVGMSALSVTFPIVAVVVGLGVLLLALGSVAVYWRFRYRRRHKPA